VEALQRWFPHGPTEWRDPGGGSLLHWVVQTPHLPVRDWLLTFPMNVNESDHNATTPLMWACYCQKEAMVRRLLDYGADLQATGPRGWTALHYACFHQWVDGVTLLLEQGADPDARDGEGHLPEDLLFVSSPHHATLCALLEAARHGCGLK
jgi:uncharacterized protein